jgi:hypothetical protein
VLSEAPLSHVEGDEAALRAVGASRLRLRNYAGYACRDGVRSVKIVRRVMMLDMPDGS